MSDPLTAARDQLRQSLTALKPEQERLDALQAARERAREQSFSFTTTLHAAEDRLRQAKADEPARKAYAFVNQERDAISPLEGAQAELDRVRDEARSIDDIEQALAAEIERVRANLRHLQANHYEAMAEVVSRSDAYQALLQQHRDDWQRLRTTKEILRHLAAQLHDAAPNDLIDTIAKVEPLEIRIGYSANPEPVQAWSEAMAALKEDPDAPLPSP